MKPLRLGELIRLQPGGEPHRVAMVNPSRAYVVPVKRLVVEIKTVNGEKVSFMRLKEGVSISPYSEVERIQP